MMLRQILDLVAPAGLSEECLKNVDLEPSLYIKISTERNINQMRTLTQPWR